ncbi:MAG: type II toxin-antitoxin system VapC family toxin [bacterium]|nr:type II toxin-antitoxin system VapC family toxin [bacterium]
MKYIWDTDTCIYFFFFIKKIAQKAQSIGAENICTTLINIIELQYGAYNSSKVESNLARVEKLKSGLTILANLNDELGAFFAKNKAHLKKKGITIGDFDLLIASFASVNNLPVVTNNLKHFKHIPDIKIENWLND